MNNFPNQKMDYKTNDLNANQYTEIQSERYNLKANKHEYETNSQYLINFKARNPN